jgi:hypothetical protein
MWRDEGDVSVSPRLFLGVFVLAKRFDSKRSSFSVTASSMIAARSPSGTVERIRLRSLSSLSCSSALAVNWILYLAGERGATTGR